MRVDLKSGWGVWGECGRLCPSTNHQDEAPKKAIKEVDTTPRGAGGGVAPWQWRQCLRASDEAARGIVLKLSIRTDLLTAGNSAFRKCPAWVRQSLFRVNQLREVNWRRGESAVGKSWKWADWRAKLNTGQNGERQKSLTPAQLGTSSEGLAVNKLRGKRCRERSWLLR